MEMRRVDIISGKPPSFLPAQPDRNREGPIIRLCVSDLEADLYSRWPLALRFIKGAIHAAIILPVTLHGLFAALAVFLDQHLDGSLGLPASIVRQYRRGISRNNSSLTPFQIPSLSIVVGLMLASPIARSERSRPITNSVKVFRNQTAYNRFWDGRNYLTVIITSIRNLTRSFLACSAVTPSTNQGLADQADTERVVRILVAILYATKNHLRAEWGADIIPGAAISVSTGIATHIPEYSELLPQGLTGLDDRGVGLPLQLTFFVEQYIKKCFDKGMFHGPQASQLQVQLNTLTDAYGRMETIRLTSIPVAHL